MIEIKVKRLHPEARLPVYATEGAACFDLHSLPTGYSEYVRNGQPVTLRTGLAFEIPEGYVMLLYSRSGAGFRHGVRLANCTGVIDSDYRGEVVVRLVSDSSPSAPMVVQPGDRIAQAMVIPVPPASLKLVDELSTTVRGTAGFGSTGTAALGIA